MLTPAQKWNGKFFEKTSLSNLGLWIQLGHDGASCPCPCPGPQGFMVFDVSGAHYVNIDYCGCRPDDPMDRRTQHLRHRWFPATLIRPQTVFTFDFLNTFHELTLQSKGNLYDFYLMILRKTDNANITIKIVSLFAYEQHLLTCTQNRFPEAGGLTVECPACPHPGKNLPAGWENAGALRCVVCLDFCEQC